MRDPLFYQLNQMIREFNSIFYNPRTMTIEQAEELERQRNRQAKWNYYAKLYASYMKGKEITTDEVLDSGDKFKKWVDTIN
jgi:hypothetical protein